MILEKETPPFAEWFLGTRDYFDFGGPLEDYGAAVSWIVIVGGLTLAVLVFGGLAAIVRHGPGAGVKSVFGVIAIMALELGTPMSSLWVRIPVLIGGILLLAVTADALVRVWRSVRAWWDVDRGRAWFRLVWVAVLAGSLLVIGAIIIVVLSA